MKIPDKDGERLDFVQETLQRCSSSQQGRIAAYRTLKQYALYGQESGTSANQGYFGVVNKIDAHIDKTSSMLYSPENVRFAVEIGRSVERGQLARCDALTDAVYDRWHAAELGVKFDEALRLSLHYGSEFVKLRPVKEDVHADLVDPHNVGVYREDICGLENQEAFFHEYRITKSQLLYQLILCGKTPAEAESLASQAVANVADNEVSVTQPIDRIVTSSALPNAQGEINTFIGSRLGYVADISHPLVRMYELYAFDDALGDFRVFTCAHPYLPIFDRPIERMFLAHDLPLIQVCPFPMHGYFWGISAVERLLNLQMIRNTRWDQVQHLMELQAAPPFSVVGSFMGEAAEMADTLDSPAGVLLSDNNGGKVERLAPQMPEDLFAEVNYIDSQFDDAIGTTEIMAGKGDAGVRSEGHANQLLRTGSSRIRKRALIVERQIEDIATLLLRIEKVYSDRTYTDSAGQEFLAEQFTDDFMVKVDAHSASPVIQQDMANLAFSLFKAKAITRQRLIDMLPVPMKDLLKRDIETKIEPAEAAAQKRQEEIEIATGKVAKIGGKK